MFILSPNNLFNKLAKQTIFWNLVFSVHSLILSAFLNPWPCVLFYSHSEGSTHLVLFPFQRYPSKQTQWTHSSPSQGFSSPPSVSSTWFCKKTIGFFKLLLNLFWKTKVLPLLGLAGYHRRMPDSLERPPQGGNLVDISEVRTYSHSSEQWPNWKSQGERHKLTDFWCSCLEIETNVVL